MKISVRHWILPLVVSLICLVIAFTGEAGRLALRYVGAEQVFQSGGISYRWLTGHYTHLGWRHVGLNLLGLVSIWIMYGRVISPRAWLVFLLICPLGISLGLSFVSPQTTYYVGLSGVLHGILAAAVTRMVLTPIHGQATNAARFRWEDMIVLIGLWGKIAYEQMIGSVPLTAALSGGAVVVDAHLYGACIGTCFAGLFAAKRRLTLKFADKLTPHL